MTGELNNTDHPVTMSHSAGKPWVLAFTWMPVWQVPLIQTPLQTKCGHSCQDTPQWQWPPSRTIQLHHCKKGSGTIQGTCQSAQSVNLASEFSGSQTNWTSVWCTMSLEQSMGAPTWMGLGSGASHRCSTGVGSEEFKGQFNTLSSLSGSSDHSWAVSAVLQVHCPAGGHCHQGVLLPWGGIHINARTQECPAEYLIVTTWSMLPSPISVLMFWLMVYM